MTCFSQSDDPGGGENVRPASSSLLRLGFAVTCAVMAHLTVGCAPQTHTAQPGPDTDRQAETKKETFPVVVRKPSFKSAIPTGTADEKGQPVTVACTTCHTTRPANQAAKLGTPLEQFHQGQVGRHGNLTCVSCHNPADGYHSLRLADGKSVAFDEVMTLCAQCHGPQHRDYLHGAHGGMTGYWDLTKGGRTRNSCVHCHDPHAPKYPTVVPAPGPNDRFLTGGGHE